MLAELLVNALGQMLGEITGESFEALLDRRALDRGLSAAVARAEQRFAREYRAEDVELADALVAQTRFADLPSVRAALRELLTRPFHNPAQSVQLLQRSFGDVLPERIDRARGRGGRCVPELPRSGSALHSPAARAVQPGVPKKRRRERPHDRRQC
ncbi:MAG TPA: hypothetical protein VFU22_02500 [Roseiflexaceae bacterium]|nr:hypothetical protein [Roseiflexaceae bacterium]